MKFSMRKHLKKAACVALAATMAVSAVSVSAFATVSDSSVFPQLECTTTPMTIDEDGHILTTMSQRAASEIPLVFGLNVVGGNLFAGYIDMGGSSVTASPDPYVLNYNAGYTDSDIAYQNKGNSNLLNADGLYSSGGGNQVYAGVVNDYDVNVGYAVGERTDVIIGFNSALLDQISTVRTSGTKTGDSSYNPLIIDVQTGSATSRLYAWTEMGEAITAYLTATNKAGTVNYVRYDDPYTTAVNIEQFSAGIPYYIASLINAGTIDKKTAAYVTSVSSVTTTEDVDGEEVEVTTYYFTCEDPGTLGNVTADVFAEVNNFDFITCSECSVAQLKAAGMEVLILGTTGYSYTDSQGNTGTSKTDVEKSIILEALEDAGYDSDDMPIVMDNGSFNITIGNNGYNYSPITCMFMPYIQAYAYMDDLASVNTSVNPMALFRYMIETFFHVKSDYSEAVAQYYISSKWDSAGTNDTVPSTTSYTYSTSGIEAAVKTGISYALSTATAEKNRNTLLGAYRTSDNAYKIIKNYLESSAPTSTTNYITLTVNNATKYLNLDTIATDFPGIVEYYNGNYNHGTSLQKTLQSYIDRMDEHVWAPVTTMSGTYGYGLTASITSD